MSAAKSSISKAERLLDLVIALLHSRHYRTAAWVREHVAGYDNASGSGASASGAAAEAAFARMFERDKQELREMGIPIETQPTGDGYRIPPGDYALPPLELTPTESVALAVAARLWDTTALGEVGESALRKLRDAGPEPAEGDTPESAAGPGDYLHARIRTAEPAFRGVFTALRSGRAVRFDYRGVQDASPVTRVVEPWGLVNHQGAWYLVGFDQDRRAQRTFRLSRINGPAVAVGRAGAVTVPADLDLKRSVTTAIPDTEPSEALLRIRTGRAAGLRRQGTVLGAAAGTASGIAGGSSYDDVRVPMSSVGDMARRVAAHGADIVVADPAELRAAVIALLRQGVAR